MHLKSQIIDLKTQGLFRWPDLITVPFQKRASPAGHRREARGSGGMRMQHAASGLKVEGGPPVDSPQSSLGGPKATASQQPAYHCQHPE